MAGNVKADSLKYTTARTTYHSIPGAAFRAERSIDTFFISLGSGGAYMVSDLPNKRMMAPVQLPNKAALQTMTVHAIDWSAADNLEVILWRKKISDNFFPDNLSSLNSSGASGTVTIYTTPITGFESVNVIDNTIYTYFITVGTTGTWSGTLREIRSIVLTYTMAEPVN